MNLIIDFPQDERLALEAKARAHGLLPEADLAPDWLRQAWATAARTGTDRLTAEEIDAEFATAREARRGAQHLPGS